MSSGSVKLAHLGEDENRPAGLWKGGYSGDTSVNKLSCTNSSGVGLKLREEDKTIRAKCSQKCCILAKKVPSNEYFSKLLLIILGFRNLNSKKYLPTFFNSCSTAH